MYWYDHASVHFVAIFFEGFVIGCVVSAVIREIVRRRREGRRMPFEDVLWYDLERYELVCETEELRRQNAALRDRLDEPGEPNASYSEYKNVGAA